MNLTRGENGLGLSLTGGQNENRPIEVSEIYRDQPAALSGQLRTRDVVLAINNVSMVNRSVHVRYHLFNSL